MTSPVGADVAAAGGTGPSNATQSQPQPSQEQVPAAAIPSHASDAGTPIEIDRDYIDDNDSALGDDISTYSTSLISSVNSYQVEYGRTYHAYKDSGYIRPVDENEVDRLDMMHHIFKVMQGGKLYEAPIPEAVQRVLDIGCGTGIWAIEFADEHPSAEILGVDLAPIQPNMVPPNVKFEIDDVEEEFPHTRHFDYIHCRYMAYAIRDWPRLVQQIFQHTAPGGFVEFTDYDLTYRSDDGSLNGTTLKQWADDMPTAGRMFGREPCPGLFLEQWVRDAGFTNIVHKVYKLPLGPWAADRQLKMLGAYNHMMVSQGAEGFSLRLFIKVLGWSHEEVQVMLARVRRDMNDKRIHAYMNMHEIWAQKPDI